MKKINLAIIASFCFCMPSCEKSEEIKPAYFTDILSGNWTIDKNFEINGVSDTLNKVDKYTIISFEENLWWESTYGGGWLQGEMDDRKPFSIQNDLGLYQLKYANGDYYNTYFSKFLQKFMGSSSNAIYLGALEIDSVFKKVNFGIRLMQSDCNECYNNHVFLNQIELSKINQLNFNYYDFLPFNITNLASSKFDLTLYSSLYGRIINGINIPDTTIFHLTRSTESQTILIPPFNPNDYQISDWVKFNTAEGITWYGNCTYGINGVDNKCLLINPQNGSYLKDNINNRFRIKKGGTISFWISPYLIDKPKQVIVSKYANQYGPFIIALEHDKITIELNNGFGSLVKYVSKNKIEANKWSQLVITVDGNNSASIYINGNHDSNFDFVDVDYDATTSNNLLLGITEKSMGEGNWSEKYSGGIDEFIKFNKRLTSFEVSQLYVWHLTN